MAKHSKKWQKWHSMANSHFFYTYGIPIFFSSQNTPGTQFSAKLKIVIIKMALGTKKQKKWQIWALDGKFANYLVLTASQTCFHLNNPQNQNFKLKKA